ncbi:MAG: hypothetical protein QNK04_01255 [Myxococcota bacterium]|nr:hypothetical protein [Myxococcota bacterium]
MPRHTLVVFTRPAAGCEDDYNQWYNETHLPEVLQAEGFVAAQRFKLAPTQMMDNPAPAPYLAIYEIETDDVAKALDSLQQLAGSGEMHMSEALDTGSASAWAYSAVSERLSA